MMEKVQLIYQLFHPYTFIPTFTVIREMRGQKSVFFSSRTLVVQPLKVLIMSYVRIYIHFLLIFFKFKIPSNPVILSYHFFQSNYSYLSNNCGRWIKHVGVKKLKNQLDFFHQFLC